MLKHPKSPFEKNWDHRPPRFVHHRSSPLPLCSLAPPAVHSQISTITMAAFNTTVASFNVGYADFFTEHMKKLCTPAAAHDIMPSEPLACANLPRSLTDSCINYSCLEDGESIEGTNNFILKNGMLDLNVSRSPRYLHP